MLGASFGLASIVGPAAGGFITEHFSWRWLFFINLPVAIVTLVVVALFMHGPSERRKHAIDVWGRVALSTGLAAALLAPVWGGTQFAWTSWQIIGLYAAAAILLGAFVWVERHAPEPVLPLHLFQSGIFTLSNIASVGVAMSMFGAIFFLPVFVQGVIGNSVTNSGAILVPMLVSMIVTSVAGGWFISHTGRYKMPLLAGLVSMGAGYYMLATFSVETTNQSVIEAMILIGLGLGITMQTFTLVVQNSVSREDMAVATSATQLSRSVGAAIGLAILGTILTQGMQSAMAKYLPASVLHQLQSSDRGATATAVFDPSQLAHLPPAVAAAIRHGLADALHPVFLAGLPIIAVSFIATLFIKEVALGLCAILHSAGRGITSALYFVAGLALVFGILSMFALPLQQAVLGTCPAPPQPCSGGLQRPLTVAENTGMGFGAGFAIASIFVGFFGLFVLYRRRALPTPAPPVRKIPPVAAPVSPPSPPASTAPPAAPSPQSSAPENGATPELDEPELPAHEEEERPELPPHESAPPTT